MNMNPNHQTAPRGAMPERGGTGAAAGRDGGPRAVENEETKTKRKRQKTKRHSPITSHRLPPSPRKSRLS